jgi:hypothetical protein
MKYAISILVAIFLSGTFSIDAEAQLLNRLKKKAKQAAEQKAEDKLTEQVEQAAQRAVERSWNSIFGEFTPDSSNGMQIPFTIGSNVKTEDAYHFNVITTMEIQTVRKDGEAEPPVIMAMHFGDDAMYTGTRFESEEMQKQEGDLFIIYDFKNAAMLMLMSNEKDKFSFAYNWQQNFESTESNTLSQDEIDWDEVDEWQNYKKIGTKSILGYDCDGYRSQTDREIVEVWVSRDTEFGINNLFQANANAKQLKGKIPADYPRGMIMEMHAENLERGEKTMMKIIDIDKNADVSYAMADYPKMSLSAKPPNK